MVTLPAQPRASIATRTALILSLVIGAIFVIAAGLSFVDTREQMLTDALSKLDAYNHDVSAIQQSRFQRLAAAHRNATELLRGELSGTSVTDASSQLGALFPRHADGTRRSAPQLYDGGQTAIGFLRGVGAFLPSEPNAEQARRLVAATRVVHALGEGLRPDLKSLYFFDSSNNLVMFAPDRADRLRFYRSEAPASLDFQNEEFARITRPDVNPRRETRCTSLRPIIYDRTRRTWTTGCMTPIEIDGVRIGSWGTSVMLDDLLGREPMNGLPSADVILISREGRLIRHPDYTRQNHADTERYLDLTQASDPRLQALWRFVRQNEASGNFVGHVPSMHAYVSLHRMAMPSWYVLTIQPDSIVTAQAMRSVWRLVITASLCLLLQALLLFLILRRKVGRPLRKLKHEARALIAQVRHEVATDEREERFEDEVHQLTHHFQHLATEVLEAQAMLEYKVAARTLDLQRANAELQRLSEVDPLTGLANRRRLMREIEGAAARATDRSRFSVLIFDVDHFKGVNDSHGHAVGDRVLQALADGTRQLFRPGDLVGRIGGEEFLAILHRADIEAAFGVAERVRKGLALIAVPSAGGKPVTFTVSIGVAEFEPGDTAQRLFQHADAALYAAKRGGRNRVERWQPPVAEAEEAA